MPRFLVFLAVALALAAPAAASEQLDVDVDGVTLRVNARGEALVGYTRSNGVRRDVLVWGAVNATPPSRDEPQVRFAVDYSGGWKTRGRRVAASFRDACRPYDGPARPLLVAACSAADGSFWALQRWQRLLPLRGFEPFRPQQAAQELHLSHWTGPLPGARGVAELDLRRAVAGPLRPPQLPRRAGLRHAHPDDAHD